MDAGAGALISRGLMEKIPLSFMEKCVLDIKRAQGNTSTDRHHGHLAQSMAGHVSQFKLFTSAVNISLSIIADDRHRCLCIASCHASSCLYTGLVCTLGWQGKLECF